MKLDPNGVANAAQWTATFASEAVGTCLRALESDEHSKPQLLGNSVSYYFGELGLSADERRIAFRNWVLCNGFRDLIRGVRACLEEAILYLAFVNRPAGVTTLERIRREKAQIIERAQRMNFPTLLASVNSGLMEPLSFDREFATLQAARNCLEHRHGIVTEIDADPESGKLVLSYHRIRIFLKYGDLEVEMQLGKSVSDHFLGIEFPIQAEIPLFVQRELNEINFLIGEHLTLSTADFYEIALACHFFAADVSTKLPQISPKLE